MDVFGSAVEALRRRFGSPAPALPQKSGGGATGSLERRAARPSAGTLVIPDQPVWAQMRRIGGGITPEQVSSTIRQADIGQMADLIDLGNECKQKDCHLQSILATSEEAIAGLRWEMVLPDNPKLKERKAAERVENALRQNDTLTRTFAHHAGATYYGYAVSEILWAKLDGYILPSAFSNIAPRRFNFHPETGHLVWYDSYAGMPFPGVDFRAAYPNKFLVSQPRINGDVACREGLIRPLVWSALFRNWSLADWLKLGEIAWKPWRWAQYGKDNASEEEVADIIAVLEGMTSSGVAALPSGVEVHVDWPKNGSGSTSMHHELFSTVASEMSKCVLGQTLTTEQGRVGSQALGNVHNEVRKDLRESRAAFVANDVNRDVVAPMFLLNEGPGVRPSKIRFVTDDAIDLAAFSSAVKQLREAGTRIPAAWVRDQAGIPEPDDDEELLGDSPDAQDPQSPPNPQAAPGADAVPEDPAGKPDEQAA